MVISPQAQDPETGTPRSSVTTAVSCAQAWPQPSHSRVSRSRQSHTSPADHPAPAVNPHRHHISDAGYRPGYAPALLFPEISPAQRSERRARPISTLACFDMNPRMSSRLPGLYGTPGTERPHPLNTEIRIDHGEVFHQQVSPAFHHFRRVFKYHRQKVRIINFAVAHIPGVLQFLSEHPGWRFIRLGGRIHHKPFRREASPPMASRTCPPPCTACQTATTHQSASPRT